MGGNKTATYTITGVVSILLSILATATWIVVTIPESEREYELNSSAEIKTHHDSLSQEIANLEPGEFVEFVDGGFALVFSRAGNSICVAYDAAGGCSHYTINDFAAIKKVVRFVRSNDPDICEARRRFLPHSGE